MLFELQPSGALLLYSFRFVDPVTGKWVRARYVAELHEIAARHERWEIIGGPEIRTRAAAMFSPSSKLTPRAHLPVEEPENEPPENEPPETDPPVEEPPANDPPMKEPPIEDPSALDEIERFLLLVFLRRYITYCARRGRYAAANGAARLFAGVRASDASHRGTLRQAPFANRPPNFTGNGCDSPC
jgi:hypothetical protein